MRRVDDRRARAEAAGPGEELDRPARRAPRCTRRSRAAARRRGRGAADRAPGRSGRSPRASRTGRRGRSGGRGRRGFPRSRSSLDLGQVLGGRGLPEAVEAAAPVGGVEEDELDAGRLRGLRGRERLLEAEVVELADRGVPRGEQLAVDALVVGAHALRRLLVGQGEHRVAPGPEVAAFGAPAKRPLKGMAVRVDEARDRETPRHEATLSAASAPAFGLVPMTSSPIRSYRGNARVSVTKVEQIRNNATGALYP